MNNYLLGRQGPSFISVVRHSKQTKSESTFHYFILPFCNETTGENTVGNWQRNQIYHNIRYVSTKTNLIRTCGFLLANLPIEKELRNVSGNFSDELKSNPYDKVPCFSYQKVPEGRDSEHSGWNRMRWKPSPSELRLSLPASLKHKEAVQKKAWQDRRKTDFTKLTVKVPSLATPLSSRS